MWLGEAANAVSGNDNPNDIANKKLNPVLFFMMIHSPNARKHIQAFATPRQSSPESGVLISWMCRGEVWLRDGMNDWLYASGEQSL
jgi:hypothetical protein